MARGYVDSTPGGLFEDKGGSPGYRTAAEREKLERHFQQRQLVAHRQDIVDNKFS
jgi:hypothetical protein